MQSASLLTTKRTVPKGFLLDEFTWLLGFGDAVEVLGPAPLRAELAAIATKMAARYAREPGKGPAGKGSSRPPPKGYLWES